MNADTPMGDHTTTLVVRAARFAADAHAGQTDKAGIPYICHPAAVAEGCRGASAETVAAAWLHDVVEDCDTTLYELRSLFGNRVAELVDLLTRRDGETHADAVERACTDPDATTIKWADVQHNGDVHRLASLDDEATVKRLRAKYAKAQARLGHARRSTILPTEALDAARGNTIEHDR